jgi:hypothetical protein
MTIRQTLVKTTLVVGMFTKVLFFSGLREVQDLSPQLLSVLL